MRAVPTTVRTTLLALFFLTGACGLVYEVVWMRMLTLIFGATAFATSTILASFFAGLALGGFWFGRVADRTPRPLRVYGLLEAGIGLFAFAMPLLLAGLTEVYVGIARHGELGFYPMSLVRFGLAFAVLVVPATLMGGSLPVMVRFFAERDERVGWNVGRLYAVNTFGAVVGTVGAGFFLILFLGVREATYLAGALNLAIAGGALLLSRRWEPALAPESQGYAVPETREDAGPDGGEDLPSAPAGAAPPPGARLALWAIGISGLCALALEVLWTRALVFFLDNSTHAFTTMLTAFLLGIALGSAAIARFVDRGRRLLVWLGAVQVLIGVTAVLAIPVLTSSVPVLQRMGDAPIDTGLFWKWTGVRFAMALTVMLVPTFLMGTTLPIVTRICTRGRDRIGTVLGRVYAVNTLGGVLGSFAAGFVLVPLLGIHDAILWTAALSVGLGGVLVLAEPGLALGRVTRLAGGAAVAVLVAGAAWMGRGAMTLTSFIERMDAREVLSYSEGIGATVKVFRDEEGARYLSIDGFPVAGTSLGLLDAQTSLGHLPLLIRNVPDARVNLIGFGAGGASWGVLQHDVESVDCVELVPGVPAVAHFFPDVNHGVLDDPRFNLILGDGRNHALVSDRTYDLISIDATSPKMAGNGSLYTLDFYRLLERRLSERGMVAQWLPFHLLSDREVRMTARTFMTVFPHTTLWFSPIRHHAVLVGTRDPLRIDLAALEAKLEVESIRTELRALKVSTAADVLSLFIMGEEELARYVGDARMNTDNHPYLEFMPAMAYFMSRRFLVQNLVNLARHRERVTDRVDGTGAGPEATAAMAERLDVRFQSTAHTILGDVLYYAGHTDRARREYLNALRIDPTEKNWAHPAWHSARPPR